MTPPDTLACAIAWLSTHPELPEQLRAAGGRPARVSSRDGGRYPWLRVRVTPAGAGGLLFETNTELQLELLDTPEGPKQVGDEQALLLLQACLWLLYELTEVEQQPIPGRHEVVTDMTPSAGPAPVDDPGVPGRPRWIATVSVNAHPAANAADQED